MSSLRKIANLETKAFNAHRTALAAVVTARMDGADEDEIARLSRRAAAHRAQWQGLAARLERTEFARDLQGVR